MGRTTLPAAVEAVPTLVVSHRLTACPAVPAEAVAAAVVHSVVMLVLAQAARVMTAAQEGLEQAHAAAAVVAQDPLVAQQAQTAATAALVFRPALLVLP